MRYSVVRGVIFSEILLAFQQAYLNCSEKFLGRTIRGNLSQEINCGFFSLGTLRIRPLQISEYNLDTKYKLGYEERIVIYLFVSYFELFKC